MFQGELIAIYIGPESSGAMHSVDRVEAVAGQGLVGDRYAARSGRRAAKAEQQVTLIESEAIAAAVRDYGLAFDARLSRRNLLTRGVPLNHLVGETFAIGQVIVRGLELCEPCGHLEKLTLSGIKKALLHRGGLRAEILRGGVLEVGNPIQPVQIPDDLAGHFS